MEVVNVSNVVLDFKVVLFQLQGHTQEAIEACTDIISRNQSDYSSIAVATNNPISLRGTKDVSDSLRRLDRLIEKGRSDLLMV